MNALHRSMAETRLAPVLAHKSELPLLISRKHLGNRSVRSPAKFKTSINPMSLIAFKPSDLIRLPSRYTHRALSATVFYRRSLSKLSTTT
jgi:hypothetical protein